MKNYKFQDGDSPLVATAIHNGHFLRSEILSKTLLNDDERLREEDPYTADLTRFTDNRIEVIASRFEVDINRSRDKAIYEKPEDAWGLNLWTEPLTPEELDRSLHIYDEFYRALKLYLDGLLDKNDFLMIYDIHSYNHRREGRDVFADPDLNPEINVGLGNTNTTKWRPVIEALENSMKEYVFEGRSLDVRSNVKFKGGYFSKWIYEHYPERICVVAIEFKKFFMDEYTGEVDIKQLGILREMLSRSAMPVTEALLNPSKIEYP